MPGVEAQAGGLRQWLATAHPEQTEVITDPGQRRALVVELVLVLAATLGLAGLRGLLALLDALLAPAALPDQAVAINAPARQIPLLDLAYQVTGVIQLIAWGGLGGYLLWRSGVRLRSLGLDRGALRRDASLGVGLAAAIGIPGLGLYLIARAVGLNLTVLPSALDDTWWRVPVLLASAVANALAEELLVVGYLITRLRQLGWGASGALVASALLRGSYHLYQGFGGFLGNVVMGLVFGQVWQRTRRLWALVIGHAVIDVVAFVGYAVLHGRLGWLP